MLDRLRLCVWMRPVWDAIIRFVGNTGKNHICAACKFDDIVHGYSPVWYQSFCLSTIPVEYEEFVSMGKQTLGDPVSHVAQTNQSEFYVLCSKNLHIISRFPQHLVRSDTARWKPARLRLILAGMGIFSSISGFFQGMFPEEALHIRRKFEQKIANRIRAEGTTKAIH